MYSPNLNLKHSERVLSYSKVDLRTGECEDVKVGLPKVRKPKDVTMDYFDSNQSFRRSFTKAWNLLREMTDDKELLVAYMLAEKAKAYTNSLEPLNPEWTKVQLSEELGIDRRIVGGIIDKLFRLGVIGKFEVYNRNEDYKNYWIFNPYLSFNGKVIKKDVHALFSGTYFNIR